MKTDEIPLKDCRSEIDLAARSGQIDVIKLFLKSGFNINSKNEQGHSLLMLAAYNGQYNLVEFLISQNADVNSLDPSGNSILMGVVFKGHTQIFDLLIQANADLEIKNKKNQTALDFSILFGRRDIILKINKMLNQNHSVGKVTQLKAWINYIS